MEEWPTSANVLKLALQSHEVGLDADFVIIKPWPLKLELK